MRDLKGADLLVHHGEDVAAAEVQARQVDGHGNRRLPAVDTAAELTADLADNMAVQEMDTGELIRSSGLERSYYYQVMKGTRSPGRDKVLRLCLAAGLNLKETTRALELSGNAVLYPRKRRDIILTVAVNQMADVDDTNLLLFKYGEKPLG